MNARTARLAFRLRTPINCAIIGAIFIPLVFVLSQLPYGWIASMVAIGVLHFYFFHVLEDRAISFQCQACERSIASNTPWVCGSCGEGNRKTAEYPFIYRCEHCSAEPKAYRCHHDQCGDLIFLSEDRLAVNPAYVLKLETPVIPVDNSAIREEEKSNLLHQIDMVNLKTELDQVNKRKEKIMAQPKSTKEKIASEFEQYFAEHMGAREYARRRKERNAKDFEKDPELLEEANETVDAWLRERGVD